LRIQIEEKLKKADDYLDKSLKEEAEIQMNLAFTALDSFNEAL
jgi:hypothetical protein